MSLRLPRSSRGGKGRGPGYSVLGRCRIEPYGFGEMSLRFCILSLAGEDRPQVVVGIGVAGIEPQRLGEMSRRRLVLPVMSLDGYTAASADLTLHATNNLRFNFDYYHTSDSGPTFTTESLDFFDSPSYWGTFARANPYYLYAPISDDTNRFTGGIDYTYRAWTFHYNLGYQTFTENVSLNNVSSPELSIDPAASSTTEPLTNLSQSEYRRLTTPISEFSFTGKPLSKFEWRGGYIYYRYQGPATFDQSYNGTAPNSSGALAPYTVSQTARDTVT